MTNVQSKLFTTCDVTCKGFTHPWTDHCLNGAAGLMLSAIPYSLRVYGMVYMLSLLFRRRIPTKEDIRNTLAGIFQSSAFLVSNCFGYQIFNCLLRNLLGQYYCLTTAFVPSFLASWCALCIERPARRPLLAFYVANVATETLWNMAVSRGYVSSIPQAQTLIFGVSVSILLYLYRLGLHKTDCKDSIFNILGTIAGKKEGGPLRVQRSDQDTENTSQSRPRLNLTTISGIVQTYGRFIEGLKGKHASCPHTEPCAKYALLGGLKLFLGGVSLKVTLKLLMNLPNIVTMKMAWRQTFWNKGTLDLGICLGSFSLLYKGVSCILRHAFGRDDPCFAIPAGLIGSIGFTQYPNTTVALYVMWKMLHILYDLAYEEGIAPRIPGFIFILYSFSTAVLFHGGFIEPHNLRPSYYKFMQGLSGERISRYIYEPFDVFGLNTSQNQKEVQAKLKIAAGSLLPKFPCSS